MPTGRCTWQTDPESRQETLCLLVGPLSPAGPSSTIRTPGTSTETESPQLHLAPHHPEPPSRLHTHQAAPEPPAMPAAVSLRVAVVDAVGAEGTHNPLGCGDPKSSAAIP